MKIVSWNINSVRIRIEILNHLARNEAPDIICLQETKVQDDEFPLEDIRGLSYKYIHYVGEKSYNGVCILSKFPMTDIDSLNFCAGDGAEARHIMANIDNKFLLHNFYIPAGGDIPDAKLNPKFGRKLEYIENLIKWLEKNHNGKEKIILAGDLNIAPLEHDVWSHKQLITEVSHSPIEVEMMMYMIEHFGWIDSARHFIPKNEKSYSWWSYRNKIWSKSNRGRRLDHIWTSAALKDNLNSYQSLYYYRDFPRTSDHVPIILDFRL